METTQIPPVAADVSNRPRWSDVPTPPRAEPESLDERGFLLIRQAAARRRAIGKAARTAKTSGVVTLVIGISAVPMLALWPSWLAAVLAFGLCVIGAVELRGHRMMRQADPAAAGYLGRNQLVFLALIIFYCGVQMATFSPEQIKAAAVSPEFRAQLDAMPSFAQSIDAGIDRWAPLVAYGFFGLVIVVSVVFQGGLATYYFTRRRHLNAYITHTPPWVRRVFIETGA